MKNILCLGGTGQLGTRVVSTLKKHKVTNVDFKSHPQAQQNILLQNQSTALNNNLVVQKVKSMNTRFDAIIVTAGGWAGGNIKDDDYFEKVSKMNEVNLYPTLLAAHLATKYINKGGLVTFTGAAAVYKQPQPQMLAYSLAKTGVHYLATALAQKAKEFNVVTILPNVIDTQMNRAGMPDADFSTWAKPDQIGQLLLSWVEGLNVPANGSFVELKVKKGCLQTQFL